MESTRAWNHNPKERVLLHTLRHMPSQKSIVICIILYDSPSLEKLVRNIDREYCKLPNRDRYTTNYFASSPTLYPPQAFMLYVLTAEPWFHSVHLCFVPLTR